MLSFKGFPWLCLPGCQDNILLILTVTRARALHSSLLSFIYFLVLFLLLWVCVSSCIAVADSALNLISPARHCFLPLRQPRLLTTPTTTTSYDCGYSYLLLKLLAFYLAFTLPTFIY